ncbi:hypothetical protein BLNAU_3460 [Blattamonas nauphoetae]|uniref:Uncharacterized protein n=1 Tax=Blattamonas nauphoetae TaxID=2049346 RepID=A0ABQ9YD19_9EUKA|nr:hypothetical protein BLNAU_3460 [Blattamonas nauphoetae]
MSFDDKSAIYISLVALVKTEYPFDDVLQDRAAQFLKNVKPKWNERLTTNQLVIDLVSSSAGSASSFVESILTLLSSPHSTVVSATLLFLRDTFLNTPKEIPCRLVKSDLITKVLATVHSHTLPISGNQEMIDSLIRIIATSINLADPSYLSGLGVTAEVTKYNHREMIFQKVVIPSSQFVTFLISNRLILNEDLFRSFVSLLNTLLFIGPFHRPTLEFVLISPIVMAFSNCFWFVEEAYTKMNILNCFSRSLYEWPDEGPEVAQSGKRMIQALFSEGFKDTLEQMTMSDKGVRYAASRKNLPRFCVLSSDVGNAMVAGADEQILGSPPIVQNCELSSEAKMRLNRSLKHRSDVDSGQCPSWTDNEWKGMIGSNPQGAVQMTLLEDSMITRFLALWTVHALNRFSDDEELHHANTPPNELSSQHCRHSLQIAVHSTPNDRMDCTTRLARSELEWPAISFLCWNWIPRWRFGRSSLPTRPDEFGPTRIPIKSSSTIRFNEEPFLYFDEHTELSFEDKSTIYHSLVTLVKAEYPFDNALQDRAARFLMVLEPQWGRQDQANQLVTDLVPSSAGSHSGFVESICTLFSSPHSTVVEATMQLGITAAVEKYNHREIILQKVVLPSSQFVTFLISNRFILNEDLFRSLYEWPDEGPEVAQSGKRMIQALFSEGFKDTLEQMTMSDKGVRYAASRKNLPRFCVLSSDVGNALIAGADEQILGSPPIVQKRSLRVPRNLVVCQPSSNRRTPRKSQNVTSQAVPLPSHEHAAWIEPNVSNTLAIAIFCSLVALVKAEYPFDKTLQDRAARFLKSLEPTWNAHDLAAMLVRDLVHSSARSSAGFVESILTLLSSPHSRIVVAALSFLKKTTIESSPTIRCRLVESDLVSKVLAIVQPHTLPISGTEAILNNLIGIIASFAKLAFPSSLRQRGINSAVDQSSHREMIFQNVVLPSSEFVSFLISNRNMLNEKLLLSFLWTLTTLLLICPFHRPTLQFVVASPIVMALSSCLSFIEDDMFLWNILSNINRLLYEWKEEGPEVVQSAKRMMQALFSEGFEDTLEQTLKYDKDGDYGRSVYFSCRFISKLLGSNVELTEDDDEEESEGEVASIE